MADESSSSFWDSSKHPWPCFFFVIPLLVIYELGVRFLGGEHPEALRNGADHWLRSGLSAVGVKFFWVPPAMLLGLFAFWLWKRWGDRPGRLHEVLGGMVLESVALALGLWALSRASIPLLDRLDHTASLAEGCSGLVQILPYLGAGIYEEALFRLALFAPLCWIMIKLGLHFALSFGLAALASAILFSAAHHVGPYGQEYSNFLFVFRLIAGIYFAVIFQYRGFGVAVGSHACYNVMVSVGVS